MSKIFVRFASRGAFMVRGAATFASIGAVTSLAKAAQYEIKCATDITNDHPVNVNLTQMWAEVERESGGRIRVQMFPNSVLGGETSMFEQTRQGALEFFLVPPGVIAALVPATDISYLGFAFADPSEGMRVFQGPLGSYLRAENEAKGLQIMRVPWDVGMQELGIGAGWRPIRTPDDMHGFKVRVPPSPILVGMMKELGANGVALNVAETYSSLQTKLIDGAAGPLASIIGFHFYEVMKYVSLTNHNWAAFYLMANGAYWKTLPSDLQEIIERNNTKFAMDSHRRMLIITATLRDKLTQLGLAFNAVPQQLFRERLKPYYRYWANAFGPTEWGLLQDSLGHKLV